MVIYVSTNDSINTHKSTKNEKNKECVEELHLIHLNKNSTVINFLY